MERLGGLKWQVEKFLWIQVIETVRSAVKIKVLQDPKVQNFCKTVEIPQASFRRNGDTVGSPVEQHTMNIVEMPVIQGIGSALDNEVDQAAVGQVVQDSQVLPDAVED